MLSYVFDTMGYLCGSGLLDSFFSVSAVAISIMVIRKMFERGN